MVDIHCHVLPGIDDGSPDLETSVAMCKAAAADGVTHIVGTPHLSDEFEYDFERNLRLRDQVQAAAGPKPKLLTGCDFHLNEINLELLALDPSHYTINQKNYLLVENSNYSLPPNIEQMFFSLRCKGIIPVLTHPERNPLWREDPDLLRRVGNQGTIVQVTAGALSGRFGRSSQKFALEWLHAGYVHVIASDAHNINSRPLRLKEAYDLVVKETNTDTADILFKHNPRAIIEGGETMRPAPPIKKRRWFGF